jgi:hypothetical protein
MVVVGVGNAEVFLSSGFGDFPERGVAVNGGGVEGWLTSFEIQAAAGDQGNGLLRRFSPVDSPGHFFTNDQRIALDDFQHVAGLEFGQALLNPFIVCDFERLEIDKHEIPETVAMTISGHKTCAAVFDCYIIVSEED